MVYLVPVFAPFISLQHRFFYHLSGSASKLTWALLLNLVFAWLVFVGVFALARRFRALEVAVWAIFLLSLPLVLIRDYAALMNWYVPPGLNKNVLYCCAGALILAVLLWRSLIGPHLPRILDVLQTGTALFSLGWLVTIGQLVYYAVATHGMNNPRPLHEATSPLRKALDGRAIAGRPRVVWLILDELGYDEALGRRFPGLALPAFDGLAAQSAVFTQAAAPGAFTEQVIPALILGKPANSVAFTVRGDLLYRNTAGTPWTPFSPADTVFSDALHLGYSTALAGWHNPYCRLLSSVLDSCFWSTRVDSATPDFDTADTFAANVAGPARRIFRSLGLHAAQNNEEGDRRYLARHIEDVRGLLAETDRLLADPTADFLMIHLPVPHPAGVYDRRLGVLTNRGHLSYVDNLALADRILGHLHAELAARGEWDSSAVLVMGDHGWRTRLLWEGQRSWTAEDQQASHGGEFDPRPAYLVKLPGQTTGVQIDAAYPTLRTRALLDGVMTGQIRTVADLQKWVATP